MKKPSFYLSCFITALLVLSCGEPSNPAPESQYSPGSRAFIQGNLLTSLGQPIANEELEILAIQNNLLLGTTTTDNDGKFSAIVLETGLRNSNPISINPRSGDNGFLLRIKNTTYQHSFAFAFEDYLYNQEYNFPDLVVTMGVPVKITFVDQNNTNLLENARVTYTSSTCLQYYRDFIDRSRSDECHQQTLQFKADGVNSITTNFGVLLNTQVQVFYDVDGIEQERLFLINQDNAGITINY
jgi:hypothetical protein